MPTVFISHASADQAQVKRDIVDLLTDHEIKSWFAGSNIASASQWERSILEGMKSCDWFLVALTPRAVQSEWVKDEVHWAIEHRPDRIVPVLLEDCDGRDIHIRLPRIQHVDFREVNDDARGRLLACWDTKYRPAARFDIRFNKMGERYSIVQDIGGGDFLSVYLAEDHVLHRPVAIKCDKGQANSGADESPVATEARTTALFTHPAIRRVFDLAEDSELGTYSVLEHIPGRFLDHRLFASQLSVSAVLDVVIPLCDASDYTHQRGVVHRNIKPASVIIGADGRSYLTNFILAKTRKTFEEEGRLVGTPAYMAPEQARGDANVDARADIWSLGILLYEMLTGERPFVGHIAMILASIPRDSPTPPRVLNPSIPDSLERICLRCLEKNPADRYSSAYELGRELAALREPRGWVWSRDRPQDEEPNLDLDF